MRKLGCEIFLGIDLYAFNGEEQADFDRTLEKHYNRRIPAREAGENVNLSMGIAVVCDSLDAVRIVEQTLSAVAARNGFLLTPAYGMQKKYYYSLWKTAFRWVCGPGMVCPGCDAQVKKQILE